MTMIALLLLLPSQAMGRAPQPAAPCLAAPAPKGPAAAPATEPQAMPVIHTEGTLPHVGIHDRSAAAMRDFPYMLDLATTWRRTGDRAALDRLAVYLDAWAATYRPSFDPIDETGLGDLIDAYALARADLPPAVAAGARDLLRALGEGYLARIAALHGDRRGTSTNNWQSHRIKIATLAAVALDDPRLLARARAAFVDQLSVNMTPGGEVIDFGERDALHYVVYDLEPLVRAALAARRRGEDWLRLPGRGGQTLAAGLDWLRPYADGTRSHQEFVHSSVRFDAQRAAAGLPGYAGPWDRQSARGLYWAASLLDPRYGATARALSPTPPRWLWAYARPCGS